MPLVTGARLGPYEILSPLGAGGMGEVYRVCDTRLNHDVALKKIDPGLGAECTSSHFPTPARSSRYLGMLKGIIRCGRHTAMS